MDLAELLQEDRAFLPPRRLFIVVVLVALVLPACADGANDMEAESDGDAAVVAEYPEWIDKVYPPPGSETSASQAVQVEHGAIAADQQVRLIIDGTDVTAYANETSPGLLEYDVDQAASPVALEPGEHTAVVELNRVTPGASEGVDSYDPDVHETIETYTWTFTVL